MRFRPDRTLGEELAIKAERYHSKPYIQFEGQSFSYELINDQAARIAGFMESKGFGEDKVIGILMPNVPTYLSIFFATQRVGATVVPINTSLKDDGLAYIINNAGITQIYTVPSLLAELDRVRDRLDQPLQTVVAKEFKDETLPEASSDSMLIPLTTALNHKPQAAPRKNINPKSVSMLMYTSGTTGYPKGVVYRYGTSQAKMTRILAHMLIAEDDIYYTCLPLFHANALIVTNLSVLYAGATLALSRKFSASKFWQEIRDSRATAFNTLGTMIAILMKQPEHPLDGTHHVRRVVSAACPAAIWEAFEKRFNVNLIESFGAVDGGGIVTMNVGNAPVGSIGKPLGKVKWRLVDEHGNDVPAGQPGELIHFAGGNATREVDYYNNEKASAEKTRGGWVHSGDLMWRDEKNFLYFAGRNSDSMRCGGENVSALEVESAVNRFSSVLESAAFGVPSELAEEDVMVVVQPREGDTVNPEALADFLKDKLPKHAQPRYIRIVNALPKTETHRVIKHLLKSEGITSDAWKAPERSR
ncbi:AMP-dependent synthetase and ligase [gamma proteobacterium HdN1]|nr:AMP-dependent synthetase and ligase [gamma proteobacterium HdN1]